MSWTYFSSSRNRQRGAIALSITGLALGLMIIIVVIGIMQGLQQRFLQDIIEIESYHISLGPVGYDELDELQLHADRLDVSGSVPYGESETLLVREGGTGTSLRLRGLGKGYQDDEGFFRQLEMIQGTFLLDDDTVVIGWDLARRHGIYLNDSIRVATVVRGRIVRAVPSVRNLRVTGIYRTGYPDIDRSLGFTSLETVHSMGFGSYYLGIKTDRIDRSAAQLKTAVPDVRVVTWKEAHESLFGALMLEKYSMFLVLLLIFLVVAINIRSTFERFLYEKRDEIAIMKTLGAERKDIRSMLLYQGGFIALLSLVPGCILGLLLASNINPVIHTIDRFITRLFGTGLGVSGIVFPVIITWPEIALSIAVMVLFLLWAVLRSTSTVDRFTPMEMFRYE